MQEKTIAKNLLDSLPEEVTIDEIIHALYIRSKINKAENSLNNGKGVNNTEAKKRLSKWLK
ncbi:MAG: hypothetical protein GXX85_11740 [Ignavibacteria bacterium]|nr:hypothetical protein [Ignavibacteria bacterium]